MRALRILHGFKLGEKNLVVKVDSKTRNDLLKYVLKKKREKSEKESVNDKEVLLTHTFDCLFIVCLFVCVCVLYR